MQVTHDLSLFSLWSSYILTTAAERIIRGAVFEKLGGVVTKHLEADKEDASEASKALLHYSYLVVSEIASAVIQPLNVTNIFQTINLPRTFSFQQAFQEVRSRKSIYDGATSRLVHSVTHRITTELIWTALAIKLSPSKLLQPLPILNTDPQNIAQRREELRERATLKWRKHMWFSLLHGLASNTTNLLSLPLSFIRSRIESQGLSFKNTDISFSGFFDALSHLLSGSSSSPIITGPALTTCVKSHLLCSAYDLGFHVVLYVAGVLAIDRIEAWCPITWLEALQ